MPATKASTTSKPVIRSSKSNSKHSKLIVTAVVAYSGSAQNLADQFEDVFGDYYNGHGEYKIEVKKVSDDEFEKALA